MFRCLADLVVLGLLGGFLGLVVVLECVGILVIFGSGVWWEFVGLPCGGFSGCWL